MLEHVERLGLSWNEAYHEELFFLSGLRRISNQDQRIGYIGVREERGVVVLDRFCLMKEKQGQGIGTQVMRLILEEKQNQGKPVVVEVLKGNPVFRLYERLGFKKVSEDDILLTLRFLSPSNAINASWKPTP